jgi:hypothetical protein
MAKKKTPPKKGKKLKTAKATSRETSAAKPQAAKAGPTRGLKAEIPELRKPSPAVKAPSPHQIQAELEAGPGTAPSLGAIRKAFASLEADGHIEPVYTFTASGLDLVSTVYDALKSLPQGCGTLSEIKSNVDAIEGEPVSPLNIEGALWVLGHGPQAKVQKVDGRYCIRDGTSDT